MERREVRKGTSAVFRVMQGVQFRKGAARMVAVCRPHQTGAGAVCRPHQTGADAASVLPAVVAVSRSHGRLWSRWLGEKVVPCCFQSAFSRGSSCCASPRLGAASSHGIGCGCVLARGSARFNVVVVWLRNMLRVDACGCFLNSRGAGCLLPVIAVEVPRALRSRVLEAEEVRSGAGVCSFIFLNNLEGVEIVAAPVQERARAVVGAAGVERAFCFIADEDLRRGSACISRTDDTHGGSPGMCVCVWVERGGSIAVWPQAPWTK